MKSSFVLFSLSSMVGIFNVYGQTTSTAPSGIPSSSPSTFVPTPARSMAPPSGTEAPSKVFPTTMPVPQPTVPVPTFPSSAPVPSPPNLSDECLNQICDPVAADACTCFPGLECRLRPLNGELNHRCSAVSKNTKVRLSGTEGVGGAAGRPQNKSN